MHKYICVYVCNYISMNVSTAFQYQFQLFRVVQPYQILMNCHCVLFVSMHLSFTWRLNKCSPNSRVGLATGSIRPSVGKQVNVSLQRRRRDHQMVHLTEPCNVILIRMIACEQLTKSTSATPVDRGQVLYIMPTITHKNYTKWVFPLHIQSASI